jgi:hypothetical protein
LVTGHWSLVIGHWAFLFSPKALTNNVRRTQIPLTISN